MATVAMTLPALRRSTRLWLGSGVAALLLLGLTAEVLHGGWVVSIDRHLELQVFLHQHHGLRDAANVLTWLGDPVTVVAVVALSTLVLAVRRDRVRAVALPVGVVAALVLGQLVRHAIGRSSPTFGSHLHFPGGDSYPSGHALGAALCLAAVAIAVRRRWVSWAAAVIAVLVAVARVYLFAHFASDVLASLLAAAVVITAVEAVAETAAERT
ncbi:MAG TPA: phosphatase PAP2 family protein [Mycobacteriales bacterium]|jgi:undecaprenyl-diphosphatase|nr:phosphatase PAP2 family protein [Mycobacteriales bacterium]